MISQSSFLQFEHLALERAKAEENRAKAEENRVKAEAEASKAALQKHVAQLALQEDPDEAKEFYHQITGEYNPLRTVEQSGFGIFFLHLSFFIQKELIVRFFIFVEPFLFAIPFFCL